MIRIGKEPKESAPVKKKFLASMSRSAVAVVAIIIFVVGVGVIKNSMEMKSVQEREFSGDSADSGQQQINDTVEEGGVEENEMADVNDQASSFDENVSGIKESKTDTAIFSGTDSLAFTEMIPLIADQVENLEISYYVDNTVINKDFTERVSEIFTLFDSYELTEVDKEEENSWKYRLSVQARDHESDSFTHYTILLGENMEIIHNDAQSRKQSTNKNGDELSQDASDKIYNIYEVKDMETLTIRLDDILQDK
jgi:hypothetical protein